MLRVTPSLCPPLCPGFSALAALLSESRGIKECECRRYRGPGVRGRSQPLLSYSVTLDKSLHWEPGKTSGRQRSRWESQLCSVALEKLLNLSLSLSRFISKMELGTTLRVKQSLIRNIRGGH